jgi:hypothetical protein
MLAAADQLGGFEDCNASLVSAPIDFCDMIIGAYNQIGPISIQRSKYSVRNYSVTVL